ncbi:MAG: hypothetical protein COS35_06480 [Zetaproteobacteria bacterium CG02_land_8_20_14_3_00_50_9]|nr:MAG: hypothetical protein AUJ57_07785 [Zetaproteobacteria bacterium CG1_02_53_45]PIV30486.1 MAG: hypothetical protein COS35_06480 [Zetaproteobacteria bacterium CG02_land_8_20_14_3_00_50_9]
MSSGGDIKLGITLSGDGSQLVGEIKLSAAEFDKMKKSAEEMGNTSAAQHRKMTAAQSDFSRKQSAYSALQIRSNQSISREIDKVQGAYERLAASGTVSQQELARASRAAESSVAALREELNGAAETTSNFSNTIGELGKAAAALYVLRNAINASQKAAVEKEAALTGLASQARYAGESVRGSMVAALQLNDDAMMKNAQSAKALQNLLSRGFSLQESINLINRFKDSAAFGRQASLGFGEAVVSATEGLKNENSILVDNAGVTKNVSVMWEEYAAEIGKSVNDLSMAEKRQAEYNGIMRETEAQLGNAARAASGLQGAQARMVQAQDDAAASLGEALTPALTGFYQIAARGVNNVVKPLIFEIGSFGTAAGAAATEAGILWDALMNPVDTVKNFGAFKQRLADAEKLAHDMRANLAAELAGDQIKLPEIGKDNGKRRVDTTTKSGDNDAGKDNGKRRVDTTTKSGTTKSGDNDALKKLADESGRFAAQLLAANDDAYTRTSNKYVEMWQKLVAAHGEGSARVKGLESAYQAWVNESAAAALAKEKEKTDRVVSLQQAKYTRLNQSAAEAMASDDERAQIRLDRDLQAMADERQRLIDQKTWTADLDDQYTQARIDRAQITALEIERINDESRLRQVQKVDESEQAASGLKLQFQQLAQENQLVHLGSLASNLITFSDAFVEIDKETGKKQLAIDKLTADQKLSLTASALGAISGLMHSKGRAMFEVGKAAAQGENAISTARAAMNAYASASAIPYIGFILGPVAAAAAVAAGISNAQKINSAQFGASASGGASVPSISAGASNVVPINPGTGAPATFGQGGSNQSAPRKMDIDFRISGADPGSLDAISNNPDALRKIADGITPMIQQNMDAQLNLRLTA